MASLLTLIGFEQIIDTQEMEDKKHLSPREIKELHERYVANNSKKYFKKLFE